MCYQNWQQGFVFTLNATTKTLVTAIKSTHLIQIFQEEDQHRQLQATHPDGCLLCAVIPKISLLSLHIECRIFFEGVKDEQPNQEINNNEKDDYTTTIKWQLIGLVGRTGLVNLIGLVGHNGLVGCTDIGLIGLIIRIIGLFGPIDCIGLNGHIRRAATWPPSGTPAATWPPSGILAKTWPSARPLATASSSSLLVVLATPTALLTVLDELAPKFKPR
jgi:hypothetical protein